MALKMALPKGHLWNDVKSILNQAGYGLELKNERSYSVKSNDPELDMRIHRAQNISPLVEEGVYDLGITGHDWVLEFNAKVEELYDLKFGKVDIVAAVPQKYGFEPYSTIDVLKEYAHKLKATGKDKIIVASEYENLTKKLCDQLPLPYKFIRSYGATETFQGVTDLIVDCTETGRSLQENGWQPVFKLFESTARIIANKQSLADPKKKDKIDGLIALVEGAKEGRARKLLKMNVPERALRDVLKILPAMKSPTISKLVEEKEPGYAIEVAVKEDQVVSLIPLLKKKGATDILEIDIKKAIK
ncbi:MAG: ATP phosphoribosyltransferase [Candidatus Bathyarchaeia archaeon]